MERLLCFAGWILCAAAAWWPGFFSIAPDSVQHWAVAIAALQFLIAAWILGAIDKMGRQK